MNHFAIRPHRQSPDSQKKKNRRMRTVTLTGLCPSGVVVAFVAHVLLTFSAIIMALHHTAYIMAVVGYASLSVVLAVKVRKLWDERRDRHQDRWEDEFE